MVCFLAEQANDGGVPLGQIYMAGGGRDMVWFLAEQVDGGGVPSGIVYMVEERERDNLIPG